MIHRAGAKIATGTNAADNFWRPRNMLGAIELATGTITRMVRGTGIETAVNLLHPDTGAQIVGAPIPDWGPVLDLTAAAACVLLGLTRFGGHPEAFTRGVLMPKTRPPYSPEFRRQMVDLVRAGRSPEDLARAFEPTAQSISAWVVAELRPTARRAAGG